MTLSIVGFPKIYDILCLDALSTLATTSQDATVPNTDDELMRWDILEDDVELNNLTDL